MVLFALDVALFCAALITLNFIIRTLVFSTLKRFGAFDPRWDLKWPRLPWRPFWFAWVKFTDWKEENFSGGAANASKASWVTQLALSYRTGHSLIGRVRLPLGIPNYSLVGEPSERHKVFVASSRSHKTNQLETEIALMPDDACAVITDPKAAITENVLYKLEERGHELCVLDVMSSTRRPSQSINFHRQVDFINERVGEDRTTMLFDRLGSIYFPPGVSGEKPFFTDMGREGFARINCFAKLIYPNSSMIDARRLIQVGFTEEAEGDAELGMTMLWLAMSKCKAYDGYVSSYGAQMLEMDERTRSNVLATIRSRTAFLDHEQVKAVSRENDVNLCDLKDPNKNLIISIPAPVGDMRTTLRPWIGSIVSLSLAVMEWVEGDLKTKTRFVIEEAQAIGEQALPGLGETAALMAGMGVQLILVVQGMAGFKKAFPKDYMSIIGNAQHVVFMATNEPETYEFIANKAFGPKTIKHRKWGFLWTVRKTEAAFITPDKVRRYLEAGRNNAIVMRNGQRSMFVKNAKSYETLPVWMMNPSRTHGETPARAWFRSVWMARNEDLAPSPTKSHPSTAPTNSRRVN
jgi:type IV secretory pathway TraG/TraD family ATPase VirD4